MCFKTGFHVKINTFLWHLICHRWLLVYANRFVNILFMCLIFRSTPQHQPNKAGGSMYVHPFICLTIHPSFSDLNEIWCIGRGRWGPYDRIQGEGRGGPKVAKMADFKIYVLRQYACNQKTNGELWYSKTVSGFCFYRFLIFVLVRVTWHSKLGCYAESTSCHIWGL